MENSSWKKIVESNVKNGHLVARTGAEDPWNRVRLRKHWKKAWILQGLYRVAKTNSMVGRAASGEALAQEPAARHRGRTPGPTDFSELIFPLFCSLFLRTDVSYKWLWVKSINDVASSALMTLTLFSLPLEGISSDKHTRLSFTRHTRHSLESLYTSHPQSLPSLYP